MCPFLPNSMLVIRKHLVLIYPILSPDVVLHKLRILSPEVVQYKLRLHEACVARLLVREWIYPILIYFIQSFFKKFGWVGGGSASLFLKFTFMWNTIGISINWICYRMKKSSLAAEQYFTEFINRYMHE